MGQFFMKFDWLVDDLGDYFGAVCLVEEDVPRGHVFVWFLVEGVDGIGVKWLVGGSHISGK